MQGKTLGHYEILGKLGSGGMGDVYHARDSKLGRELAIKILPAHLARDETRRNRFIREARAVAKLKHPNIITIYSVEEVDGFHFLTMELVEGETLAATIPPEGLDPDRFLRYAIALADAVSSAHKDGITHRDLKPANIMFDKDGRPKVLDFGLAKFTAPVSSLDGGNVNTLTAAHDIELTMEGAVVGTAPYMSPEQLQGHPVDHRTDVFSLGIILYEMATGRRPFKGQSSLELAACIMRDTPGSVSDIRSDLPPSLDRIIGTCLEKDPDRRYDSVADIRTELEALRSDIASGSAGKRRGTRIGLLAGAVVVIGLVAWWWLGDGAPSGPGSASDAPRQAKIGVLPFATLGSEDDTRSFADGMHDDLLTTLAGIADLKVISRTSVMQYRNTTVNMSQIGRELGASHLLEGSIQQNAGKVRINVQLIEATSDEHLWAQKYDRALTVENLFEIQSEIARTIAEALSVTLSDPEQERIQKSPTDDLEAFYAYNRGRQLAVHATFDARRAAIPEFERALAIDPDYVLANIALAETHAMQAASGATTREEMLKRGRPLIDHAIALDPGNPYALAVLGQYQVAADQENAEETFVRALALGPNIVQVLDIYASYLRGEERPAEAIPIIERALDLDPLSTSLHHDHGRALIALGRFDEAMQAFDRISQIDPDNPYAAHGSGLAGILSGRLPEAAYWSDRTATYDPADYENPATSALIYISLGDFKTAAERVAEALATGPEEPYPLAAAAVLQTELGNQDQAVRIARTALAAQVDDRWRSELVFLRVLRDEAIRSGTYDESLAWYRRLTPELFAQPPEVTTANVQKAVDLAHLLQLTGKSDQAEKLLASVIEVYDARYTRGAANYPLGVAKAEALALLGRTDEALAALEGFVDDGWRILWRWNTTLNPNFDRVRDTEKFAALLHEIASDLAAQAKAFQEPEMRSR